MYTTPIKLSTALINIPITAYWHLFIDQIDQPSGIHWLEEEEPGYLKSMFHGFNFILETINEPLTVDYLIKVHDFSVLYTNKKWSVDTADGIKTILEPFPKGLRSNYGVEFGLSAEGSTKNCSFSGIEKLLKQLAAGDSYFNIQSEDHEHIWGTSTLPSQINKESIATIWSIIQTKKCIISIPACTKDNLINRIETIILKFQNSLKNCFEQDALLATIATCVHELELTHPFPDGNCRTFAVLILNKLLLQHNLTPTILRGRDRFDAYAINELVDEIKLGQEYVISQLQTNINLDTQVVFYCQNLSALAEIWLQQLCQKIPEWDVLPNNNKEKIKSNLVRMITNLPKIALYNDDISNTEQILLNNIRTSINKTTSSSKISFFQNILDTIFYPKTKNNAKLL